MKLRNKIVHLVFLFLLFNIISSRLLADQPPTPTTKTNDIRTYFTVEIGLGSPIQYLTVQVDTTRSISWVPSIPINTTTTTVDATLFNASSSSTVRVTNETIDTDDVIGDVLYDTITVQGLEGKDFAFLSVNSYDQDFDDYTGGKLGLGFRSSHGQKFNLLEALKSSQTINKKIFSLSFDKGNKLQVGDFPLDYSRESSAYSYCNVTSTDDLDEHYRDGWVCEISHVFIGKADNFTEADEISGRAIFDSSYNYISVPKSYLNYFKQSYLIAVNCTEVTNQDEETVLTCAGIKETPALHLVLGGYAYTLSKESLFNQDEFKIRFSKENDNIWTLGQPFLRQFITVFNADEAHVGFFRGSKVNFLKDWTDWYQGNSAAQKANQMYYLIIGASILGALLVIILLFIIVHSFKRRRLEEHGPLISERDNN